MTAPMSAPNPDTGARNIATRGPSDPGVTVPLDPELVLPWVGADKARAVQAFGVPQHRADPQLAAALESIALGEVERWIEAREAIDGKRTFDETRELIEEAIEQKLGVADTPESDVWIRDLTDTDAVYSVGWGDDYFKIGYSIDDADVVTLTGDPAKVDVETTYTPATESRRVLEAKDRIEGRVVEAKGADDNGGRIFGVRIIAYGESKNSRQYPATVMREAVPLYEGAKAYDHHRTDAELVTSTTAGLVGTYRGVHAEGDGLYSDLHLLPSATQTAEALDLSLANQAQGLAPLVGISHDVMATYQPVVTGGRRFMEATAIVAVNSADVVADPAAGGQATRMVAAGDTKPPGGTMKTLKQLLDELRGADAAKRAELLAEHASVLEAAGYTVDDVPTLLGEPAEEKVPVGAGAAGAAAGADAGATSATESARRSTEAVHDAASLSGRALITAAMKHVGMDERLVESVIPQLPAKFTESQLIERLQGLRQFSEGIEKSGLEPTIKDASVTKDERDKKIERIDKTFAGDFQEGYHSFKEMWADWTDYRSDFLGEDVNRRILRESIGGEAFDSGMRRTESVTSTTWNLILGDAITRRLVAEYQQPSLSFWRDIVSSIVPLNDFRTQRVDAMGGYGVLPTVNEGAPYQPLTTPSNEEATYAASKKGGTEDLTLETITNDDLGSVRRIPQKLGLAAAQTLFRFVFDMLDGNVTCTFDSTALAASGHANTATSALSGANLSTIRRKMRAQAARGDSTDILSLTPKFLIVANTLEELAWQLVTAAVASPSGAPVGAASNIPNIHQGMDLRVIDYWSSTTEWWAVADPAMVPTVEIGFLNGRQDPELFVQNDPTVGAPFNSDKVVYKVRHIYGGTVLDYRGFQRGNS